MRLACLAAFLLIAASAQDSGLTALHSTLETLHAQRKEMETADRYTPLLTTAKHQLRDWVESQLGSIQKQGDEKGLEARINSALEKVSIKPPDDDQNLIGSVGGAGIKWEHGLLVITTNVGIVCQSDESAYGYKQFGGKWKRVWESEQDDYDKYTPQYISAVHVWQDYDNGKQTGPTFVLTLGNEWGCASAWHQVYYRIWRVDSQGSKLLLEGSDGAYLRGQEYILGSIVHTPMHFSGPVDVVVEYTKRSIDVGVHNREAIYHYLIDGDKVRRVAPVALGPRDFVDEWMTNSWDETSQWSASPTLRPWHEKLHAGVIFGDFLHQTAHCETPDLWQVGYQPSDEKTNSAPKPDVYFLIRWTPPYRFSMAGVNDKPWPRCTTIDPEADAWRTLFNTQGWRW